MLVNCRLSLQRPSALIDSASTLRGWIKGIARTGAQITITRADMLDVREFSN